MVVLEVQYLHLKSPLGMYVVTLTKQESKNTDILIHYCSYP